MSSRSKEESTTGKLESLNPFMLRNIREESIRNIIFHRLLTGHGANLEWRQWVEVVMTMKFSGIEGREGKWRRACIS